jgi:hypothetical protein
VKLTRRLDDRRPLLRRPVVLGFLKLQEFFELSKICQDKEEPHPFVAGGGRSSESFEAAKLACGQCLRIACRIGSYVGRIGPDSACFRGSPVFARGWNAVRVPPRARIPPRQRGFCFFPAISGLWEAWSARLPKASIRAIFSAGPAASSRSKRYVPCIRGNWLFSQSRRYFPRSLNGVRPSPISISHISGKSRTVPNATQLAMSRCLSVWRRP